MPAPSARLSVGTLPPLDGEGDATKVIVLSDGDDIDAKLPIRSKVKECCGYPLSVEQGFRLSFYWLAYESEYANEKYDTAIYTREGWFIGRYPSAFVFELKLEGSGILRDGRVINYDGECPYGIGTCFRALDPAEHALGRGVQNRPLEPFRSVAVDPRFIPIGSTIYVPEIIGVQLPDGTHHDGCLRADDQGGAIKFQKMDFFVESYFNFKFVADQLWWRLKATPYLDEPRCAYLRLNTTRDGDNEKSDWALLHSKKYRQAVARALAKAKRREVLASSWGARGRHHGAPVAKAKAKAKAKAVHADRGAKLARNR
jgi:3D (Asp-Asp-Asp) domain-containing protein